MDVPSPEQLQQLVAELNTAAQEYTVSPGYSSTLSRLEIITKAKNIVTALTVPQQLPVYQCIELGEKIAIRTFMKLKVFDAIPETGSVSLQDLSKATGAQESLLERMARVLVAKGFLDQTRSDGGEYLHTKFSRSYVTGAGPGILFQAMYDEWLKTTYNFDDYLVARGQLLHAREPDDPFRCPYTWNRKQDGTIVWEAMAQNVEGIKTFQAAMSGLDVVVPAVGHFDFDLLRRVGGDEEGRIQLVDVGGGRGNCLKQILAKHPGVKASKCVLQDVKHNVDAAKADKELPEGLVVMEHDFWKEQPIKGAKAYYMRMILHDYADKTAIDILAQLAAAMAADSRVLICDTIIPARVGEEDFSAAMLDQIMLACGGKERSVEGFEALLEAVGLELVNVWKIPGVPGGCIEGRLKR